MKQIFFKQIKGKAYINGYVWEDEIDDDMPIYYMNQQGFNIGNYVKIYADVEVATDDEFEEIEKDCLALEEAIGWESELTQLLYDFKGIKNKIIERDGYTLIINPN